MTSTEPVFDITRFIDARRMNGFNARIVILCFFLVLSDGYDATALAFAGPFLVKELGITNMAALGGAFSAGLFGILFGSLFFGWVGDNYGRQRAVIASLLVIGVFSLAIAAADSLWQLTVLRFASGLGLGGLLPNQIALNAEYAPKRFRFSMIIISFSGITLGAALPGPVAAWLAPNHGWQVLFLIGGMMPILLAALSVFLLPESIKYLVVKKHPPAVIIATLLQMDRTLSLDFATKFIAVDERTYTRFRLKQLFADGLTFITPLLWVVFVCVLLTFQFVINWFPIVLTSTHLSVGLASLTSSLFPVAGTVGALALCRPLDRYGFLPLVIMFVFALIVTPLIGFAVSADWVLLLVVFAAGFSLFGSQFGINAIAATIYPTSLRSNGIGWALGVGRLGAITGPLVGGVLLGMHLPIETLFLLLAIPLAIAAIAFGILTGLYYFRVQTTVSKRGGLGADA